MKLAKWDDPIYIFLDRSDEHTKYSRLAFFPHMADGNRDPCTCVDLDPCELYETCPIVEDPLREAI